MDSAGLPMVDVEDMEVLVHRETHFGGEFDVMLDYYDRGGKGALLEPGRIRHLAKLEAQVGYNLLALLGPEELQRISNTQRTYHQLRDLCEATSSQSKRPRLLAEMILSEEEDEDEAVTAVVQEGLKIVPELLLLLQSADFSEAESPGYGFAPALAARALGRIGASVAVIPLFEAVGDANNALDEESVDALRYIGEPAKAFLLDELSKGPLTNDTERAAAVLSSFGPDADVSRICLELLQREETLASESFACYLAICCCGLEDAADREIFRQIADHPKASSVLRSAIREVAAWSD